ncbi:P-loop containing nucleoside triphosphate hydrolase protein [Gigaspora margarita]|uniref:P-loop containing nucleoside triphosphate hydrolase protein n=1 Tax=Gigaspora margarita TaxID=4874 RepID=A0A8H4AV18_GIGMA|nr:P-loop containing nucleoside triphosphate hydrolase protein [Gigaspora margarita]
MSNINQTKSPRVPEELKVLFGEVNVGKYCKRHSVTPEEFQTIRCQVIERNKVLPKNGLDMLNELKARDSRRLSIGYANIDELLGGGLQPGDITEISGESTTGKTRLCYSALLSITCLNKENTALFIDTKNGSCANYIRTLFLESDQFADARERGMDVDSISDRIHIQKGCVYEDDLLNVIEDLNLQFQQKLIVIDSISSVFSPLLGYNIDHYPYSRITIFIRTLRNLAKKYNITILITNSVQYARPYDHKSVFSINKKPALGQTWTYLTDTTLFLSLGDDSDQRVYINRQGCEILGVPRICEVLRSRKNLVVGRYCTFYMGYTEFFPEFAAI